MDSYKKIKIQDQVFISQANETSYMPTFRLLLTVLVHFNFMIVIHSPLFLSFTFFFYLDSNMFLSLFFSCFFFIFILTWVSDSVFLLTERMWDTKCELPTEKCKSVYNHFIIPLLPSPGSTAFV